MIVSGIAKRLVAVVITIRPCTESPMPPPMQNPSTSEIYGLGYSAIAAFSAYSSEKKLSIGSGSPAIAAARTEITSPPAE